MIVQSSTVSMSAAWQRTSASTTEVSVRSRQVPSPRTSPPGVVDSEGTDGTGGTGRCPEDAECSTRSDTLSPRLAALRDLIQRMTGQEVSVLDSREVTGEGRRGRGHTEGDHHSRGIGHAYGHRHHGERRPEPAAEEAVQVTATHTSVQREAMSFSADGAVTTADGRQINFDVDLAMYRETIRSSQVRLTAGGEEPAVQDPLVLGFGAAPSLSGGHAELDLDGDGTAEAVPFVGDGSAYLALDRNGNGLVDDGSELFGPSTGNGFDELAAYDVDGNGWIDEADPVFEQLRLWASPDAELQTLADRGVGAIGLANVASPFRLQAGGQTLGEVRASGIWLGENGSAGTLHQIDVVT